MESIDVSAGKRNGKVEQEGDNAKRLKGSMAVEAFSCGVCAQLLTPPIFQCSSASSVHFICASCHDNLPAPDKNKCPCCSGRASDLARSLGMERAARSILVDSRYAERGCTEKTSYYDRSSHENVCPHAPCRCPEPGCGFAAAGSGRPEQEQEQLLDHLTGHHGWPCTTFDYWKAFDLRVGEPGAQVLCCREDGQLFLVNVTAAPRPPGRAVSVVSVPPFLKPTGFGCRVEFSSFFSHRGTAALDDVQPLRLSDWPPSTTELLCVLPPVAAGEGDEASTVRITFVCDWFESESDDSYIESDEDDTDSD